MWNWFSGKNKSNLPDATPIEIQKTKQIDQLKIFHQNVTEIQRDVEYRVNTAIDGKTVSLYITLPPRFPQDRPELKVSPRLQHSWVDNLMIVTGSPSINNFSLHSDLGAAVKEVVDEFKRNPPVFVPSHNFGMDRFSPYPQAQGHAATPGYPGYPQNFPTASYPAQPRMPTLPPSIRSSQTPAYHSAASGPGYPPQPATASTDALSGFPQHPASSASNAVPGHAHNAAQPANGGPGYRQYHPAASVNGEPAMAQNPATSSKPAAFIPQYPLPYATIPQQSQTSFGGYVMPDINHSFQELKDLSKEELEAVMASEEKMLAVIQGAAPLAQLQRDREQICQTNEQLAKENLEKKPLIEDKKRVILEKYDQLNELRGRFDERTTTQNELRQRYSPHVLQDRLRIASAQAEEHAEQLAEAFIDGKLSMEEFRKQYMDVRTLSHLRKVKEEKLNTVLVRVPFS